MRKTMKTISLALVATLVLGGAAVAQVSFSKYVAVGDSLTAGFASGGLTQFYQLESIPAILARQFGDSSFEQPLVSDPGIPAIYELLALNVTSQGVSPVLMPKSGLGLPLNAEYAGIYDNLGIPGANTGDLLTKTGDIVRLATGQSTAATLMYDLILRDGVNPAINQAIGAAGSFYTVWIGNNDVLGAATSGVALDGVTLTPVATFQTQYATLLGGILTNVPGAAMMTANIPDVTSIPFVTAVNPYLINPADGSHIPLIGEAGLITEDDYLTLGASALLAQGIGVPAAAGGTGLPLPEGGIDPSTGAFKAGVILRASEVALIRQRTAELNAVIDAVAGQLGVPVLDINGIFDNVLQHGYVIGGIDLSASFLTGGIFSYDGIHPQNLGSAIVAHEMVKFINAEFGTSVPEVNLLPYLLGTASATSVAAARTVFSWEAFEQIVRLFTPEAQMPEVPTRQPRMRQRATPSGSRTNPGVVTPR